VKHAPLFMGESPGKTAQDGGVFISLKPVIPMAEEAK